MSSEKERDVARVSVRILEKEYFVACSHEERSDLLDSAEFLNNKMKEIRDSGTNFFFEWLPQGEYTLEHRLRAATAGTFRAAPAELQSMYAPEFNGYSSGARVEVAERPR